MIMLTGQSVFRRVTVPRKEAGLNRGTSFHRKTKQDSTVTLRFIAPKYEAGLKCDTSFYSPRMRSRTLPGHFVSHFLNTKKGRTRTLGFAAPKIENLSENFTGL
jgi:hypothetical protein